MVVVGPMVWFLLVVLLGFGLLHAHPAEPMPTLGALDLGATTWLKRDLGSTLRIGTHLAAVLEVDLV